MVQFMYFGKLQHSGEKEVTATVEGIQTNQPQFILAQERKQGHHPTAHAKADLGHFT